MSTLDYYYYNGKQLSTFIKAGTTAYPGFNITCDVSTNTIATFNSIPGFSYSGAGFIPKVVAKSQRRTTSGTITIPAGCNAIKFIMNSLAGDEGAIGPQGAQGSPGWIPPNGPLTPGYPGLPGERGQPGGNGVSIGIGNTYYRIGDASTCSVEISSFQTILKIDASNTVVANGGYSGFPGSTGATGAPGPMVPGEPGSPGYPYPVPGPSNYSPAPNGNISTNVGVPTITGSSRAAVASVEVFFFIV